MRLLAIIPLLWLMPMSAMAQTVVAVAPGASSPARVAPSAKLAVPIVVDMSAAAGANLAVFTTGVTWNADRLTLDSVQAAFPTLTADLANRASGSASLTFANAMGNTQTLGTLHFTASAAEGGATIQLHPTVATNETGASILPGVRAALLNICVAPSGRWGDVNGDSVSTPAGDGNVNIIDAQQIARFSVSLTVANRPGIVARGDVTGDGLVNIIDAQQIARFSVGLTAAARTATLVATPVSVASTAVSPTASTLAAGQTLLLVATPTDAASASLAGCVGVTWASLNPTVATVDTTGLVTAVSAGAASFTVTSGGQSASAAITVAVVHVASVELAPATGSIYAGSTLQLTATPKDSIGGALSGRPVTWTSSDTTVANVSAAGLVIAKAPGAATVTATSEGVSSTAAALSVALVPVASVAVPSDTGVLFVGRTRQLTATLKDSAGNELSGRAIAWTSSDTVVATISATGLVTAVTSGTATITATSGTVSTPVTVRVAVRTVASVTVTPKTPTLIVGDSLQMIAAAADVYGEAMIAQAVVWVSSAPTIAMIAGSGLVRGIAAGTTRIIASVGTRSDTADVVVQVASTKTATVDATDSTHVVVASGSSVTVQAGVLVPGSSITVADASSTGAGGSAALGGGLTVTIAPPVGAASASLRNAAGASRTGNLSSLSAGTVLVNLEQAVGAGVQLAGKTIMVGITYGVDYTKQLVQAGTDVVVSAGALGTQVLTSTFEVAAKTGKMTVQYILMDTACPPNTWDLLNYTDRYSLRSDPLRIPVILVHGIQLDRLTCDAAEAYDPTDATDATNPKVWSGLAPELRADPRYEVWIYRYPTMLRIEQNAQKLQEWIAKKIGSRPLVLVAHSMGGLVSARYMQLYPAAPVKQLISFSSPYGGTPLLDLASDLSHTAQFETCLFAQDEWWSYLTGPRTAELLLTWLLNRIPGAADMHPTNSFIVTEFKRNPKFAKWLTSYASWFNWAMPSSEPEVLYQLGGCALQYLAGDDNDGLVPILSTRVAGAEEHPAEPGYSHSTFPLMTPGRALAKNRLSELSSVASIDVTPAAANIGINQVVRLTAELRDVEGFPLPSQVVTWSPQPTGIVSIAPDGTVTGLATGDAGVTATYTCVFCPTSIAGTTTIHVRAGASTLPAPTLIAPVSGATGVSTTPTFRWSTVVGANRYWLTVATSASALPTDPNTKSCPPTACLISGVTTEPSYTLPNAFESGRTGTLTPGTPYYWKVQGYSNAQIPNKQGQYSATGSFTTAGVNLSPVASVVVTPATRTLSVGESLLLTATLRDAQGGVISGRSVVWSSNSPSAATVSVGGAVTGLTEGTTTITATSENKSGTATLTVTGGGGLACNGTPQLGCGLALDQFSLIPAGTFQMGSNIGYSGSEVPVHSVTISRAFYMQKTEVTQGQWQAVMGSNPSYFSTCGDTCPVEQVSWNDIHTFIQQLNAQTPGVAYRLPTEAEWEYAARAGTTGEWYGTDTDFAWTAGNSGGRTHTAAGKQANAWGLYDMLGNVWEWVYDWYGVYTSASVTDPTGPAAGSARMLRGGAWTESSYVDRLAYRYNGPPSSRNVDGDGSVGFRLVRTTPVSTVVVTPASQTLTAGQTLQMSATLRDVQGALLIGRVITWTSSTPSVATIDNLTGLATAVAPGTTTITATSGGRSGTSTVTIIVTTFTSLTAGSTHTCGLTSIGGAYCWGQNFYGELGDGTTIDRLIPVAVQGGLVFSALTAGADHTCGLTSAGAAYCWGYLYYSAITNPVAVQGGYVFASLTAGYHRTCGLTSAGAAYCWGSNYYGELGDGTTIDQLIPVAVQGGLVFSALTAGGSHTCGLTREGAAYCWGSNNNGELGDGTTARQLTPVAVQSGLVFSALTAGTYHTCGLASGGAAYCWGEYGNYWPTYPVAVQGGFVFASLTAGSVHTCGLTSAGAAYCWGDNAFGALGDGTTTQHATPMAVHGGLVFTALTAGGHTCGLTSTGAAYCWGNNFAGELGDGTTTNRLVPTPVKRE